MHRRITKFETGKSFYEQLSAERLNMMIDQIEASILGYGKGYQVVRLPGGTSLRIKQSSASSFESDFTLTPVTVDGVANVQLSFGNLTGNGISLGSDGALPPYPESFSGSNVPPWTDTKAVTGDPTTLWYAYLKVVVDLDPAGDGSAPPCVADDSGITWDTYTSAQANSDDGTTGYLLLGNGYVNEDGSAATVLNVIGIGSQVLTWVAGLFYFFPTGTVAIEP
jgi:hypothetical protein